MILYALYVDAIFFPCHPYIWSTTVLHDAVTPHIKFHKTLLENKICKAVGLGMVIRKSIAVFHPYMSFHFSFFFFLSSFSQASSIMTEAMNDSNTKKLQVGARILSMHIATHALAHTRPTMPCIHLALQSW